MALAAMPIIFVNLGCEMLYVIEQRLRAQDIGQAKSHKVLQDVILTMFKQGFLEEIFKPQPVYSLPQTRRIFDRIAHSSIMRLSEASMDKLYDLMVMGLKYQILASKDLDQMYHITDAHLQCINDMVPTPQCQQVISEVRAMCSSLYQSLSIGNKIQLRQTLLAYLQDRRVKVSLFIQEGIQLRDGRMFLPAPYTQDMEVGTCLKHTDGEGIEEHKFETQLPKYSDQIFFCHPTSLGDNLYKLDRQKVAPPERANVELIYRYKDEGSNRSGANTQSSASEEQENPHEQRIVQDQRHELELLAKLLGQPQQQNLPKIPINLFDQSTVETFDESPAHFTKQYKLSLDRTKQQLARLTSEISNNQSHVEGEEDDILKLMDQISV